MGHPRPRPWPKIDDEARERGKQKILSYTRADPDTGCWVWLKSGDQHGYGGTSFLGVKMRAHRLAYVLWRGEFDIHLDLDHLCRNPSCCNPDHLEPVTARENIMRSPIAPASINAKATQCRHGHELTEENTRIQKDGRRDCRVCNTERQRRFKERARLGTAPPTPIGSRGNAKLTEDDVRDIKAALAAGSFRTTLARKYGVANSTIDNIAYGLTWRHVA